MSTTVVQMGARCFQDRLKLANALLDPDDSGIAVFDVEMPHGLESLGIRISRITHLKAKAFPVRVEGVIESIGSRDWESLDAYFDFHGDYRLHGTCTIGSFPEDH